MHALRIDELAVCKNCCSPDSHFAVGQWQYRIAADRSGQKVTGGVFQARPANGKRSIRPNGLECH